MTTDIDAVEPHTRPSTAAERMRRYRKNRRRGKRCVRIQLHASDIEELIRKKYLKPELRNDTGEIQGAVAAFFDDALNEYDKA
jgi:hypothetical protein